MASANSPLLSFLRSCTRATRPPSRIRCAVAFSETIPPPYYWATAEADIDAHLAVSIPTSPPPSVRDPILRLVSSAPRTMAPALCVAACELVGGHRDRALAAACALRLVHTAFHAQGFLLGLEDPDGPGSRSADVALIGDGVRLLTADGLLPLGCQLVGETDAGGEPGRVLRVLVEIADAAGPQGMVAGEYEEILYRQGGKDGVAAAEDWLERVGKKKEGCLYACAAACGAILGGAGEEETERLRRCGMYVGMLQGFLYGGGAQVLLAGASRKKTDEAAALAGELRSLALAELEGFEGDVKEAILGMVDAMLLIIVR